MAHFRTRVIGVGVIRDSQGRVLLLKMANDHGVYPGQWGLVGGGLEDNETIEECITREIKEELNLTATQLTPFMFTSDQHEKKLRSGGAEDQYLLFLLFLVRAEGQIVLNDEWVDYRWVSCDEARTLPLNPKTSEVLLELEERSL